MQNYINIIQVHLNILVRIKESLSDQWQGMFWDSVTDKLTRLGKVKLVVKHWFLKTRQTALYFIYRLFKRITALKQFRTVSMSGIILRWGSLENINLHQKEWLRSSAIIKVIFKLKCKSKVSHFMESLQWVYI